MGDHEVDTSPAQRPGSTDEKIFSEGHSKGVPKPSASGGGKEEVALGFFQVYKVGIENGIQCRKRFNNK